jgi:preprotein translocase subunit YajC
MMAEIRSLFVLAAESTTTAPASAPPANPVMQMLIPLGIIFVVMYFFMFSPQRKKEKQRRQMLEAVAKGDEIVTIGGICGKVWQIKDDEVVVQVNENARITFSRSAIGRVVNKDVDVKR